MDKLVEKVQLQDFSDSRGQLFVAEFFSEFDLLAKRIYLLRDVPDLAQRGGHAHKQLKQVIFCVQGSFQITVSDGKRSEVILMSQNAPGIFLRSGLWRDLNSFSKDAICLVIASELYDASDYIHNFEDYLSWRGKL
jgi:dTDP-4-dehydrorhamnose 3,5-epimerase-like enzyme